MGNRTKFTRKDRCERCRKSAFVLEVGLFKPVFRCLSCGANWSWGYDGGPYFQHATNVADTSPIAWVEHPDITAERLSQPQGSKS